MSKPRRTGAARKHARIMLWSLVIILGGALIMPMTGYVYVAATSAQAASAQQQSANEQQKVNPRASYWRAVRQGEKGYTSASGDSSRGVLIQNGGQVWREIRNGPVANITPWVLLVVLLAILAYFVIFGKRKLDASPSGRRMLRWTAGERVMHWYTAILFIVLAITGLSLLWGRAVLIPVFGIQGFSVYANGAMLVHNVVGPLFLIGVILEVITWVRYNTFKSYDWEWFKRFGGMLKKGVHPPAGRANAGEKVWFWIIATIGMIGVGVSGLILDFPNFGQSRETMQIANIVHSVLAVLWIAIAFGHIYLGTIGVQGAFEGMVKGEVSEEWMKQHHSVWYEEMQKGTAELPGEQHPESGSQPGRAST